MKKKLVIFDLDGTLLNTITDLANACNYALEKLGFPTHHENAYKIFVGNGIDILFERALPENFKSNEYVQKMREYFIPYYNEHNKDFTSPYSGIMELLHHLKSNNIKIAVVSNKYHEATLETVKYYFPKIEFDAIFGHRNGYQPKPHPAIIFDILEICKIQNKQNTLYVGDTSVDMNTAKNAGIPAVGVTWGFRSEEELKSCNPEFIIQQPIELLSIVLNS